MPEHVSESALLFLGALAKLQIRSLKSRQSLLRPCDMVPTYNGKG